MKLRPVYLFIAAVSITAAACTSSSSSTIPQMTHGTEIMTAEVTGSAAAANLNSSSNNAPLDFPDGVTWTGPVETSLKPFALGGPNNGSAHWATPAGTLSVYHQSAPGYSNNNNQPPPATWTKTGTTCGFSTTFDKGAFRYVPGQSTGTWKRVTGTGTYLLTAQGSAPLKSGKTTCTFDNIGKVSDSGALIKFTATAPITLAPETATP